MTNLNAAVKVLGTLFKNKTAVFFKKALDSELINPEPEADGLRKMAALIRHKFRVDPYELDEEKFVDLACEAIWLAEYEKEMMTAAINKAIVYSFGKDDG